MLFGYGTIVI